MNSVSCTQNEGTDGRSVRIFDGIHGDPKRNLS